MKIYISFLILFSFNNSIYIFGIEREIWIKSGTVIIAPVQTSYSAISTDLDGRLFKTGHTETPSLKYIPRQGQVFSIFFLFWSKWTWWFMKLPFLYISKSRNNDLQKDWPRNIKRCMWCRAFNTIASNQI